MEWSVIWFGNVTMRKSEIDRLQAFEMWSDMEKDGEGQLDKVTNEQVLVIVKEKRTLIDVIRRRKKK